MAPKHAEVRFDLLTLGFEIAGRIVAILPVIQKAYVGMEPYCPSLFVEAEVRSCLVIMHSCTRFSKSL